MGLRPKMKQGHKQTHKHEKPHEKSNIQTNTKKHKKKQTTKDHEPAQRLQANMKTSKTRTAMMVSKEVTNTQSHQE